MSVTYHIFLEEAGKEVPLVVMAVEVGEVMETYTEITKKGTVAIVEITVILSSFVVLLSTMRKMAEFESLIIIMVIIAKEKFGITPHKATIWKII